MNAPVTVIEPRRGWQGPGLGELWEFRELLWTLVSRELKVRYKQTLLGAAWALIQPAAAMAVFSLFFGRLAGMPSDGLPYPVFAFAALAPWTYFAQAVSGSAGSVVEYRNVITKVYFPRLILPLAPLVAGLVDLGITLASLGALMAVYGIAPPPAIFLLPAFLLLALLTALGLGLWLSALNAHYRDFRYVIPFLVQIWMFASPIAYPASLVPEAWRPLYGLNPMVGVIEGVRWSLLGSARPSGAALAASAAAVLLLLGTGLAFFRRMERTFVDVV